MRRFPRILVSWIAAAVLAAATPAAGEPGDTPGGLGTLPIPGGADALAAAAGLPVPASRATLGVEVIRRLHAPADVDPAAAAARRQAVASVLSAPAEAGAATEAIPLPFDEGLWTRIVFRNKVPAGVATAILTTPRAAWLYYGAVGLDDETRVWMARPHRVLRLTTSFGAFGAFAPSLRIRGTRVDVPGGAATDALWEALVGASPTKPELFVDKLFEARAGRLVWLYDAIDRAAPGVRAHVLGGEDALSRLRRLADVFERVSPEWRVEDRPLWRPIVDPASLLLELEATAEGVLRLPTDPAVWRRAFGPAERVDAAWLLERVFLDDLARQRDRVELVRFAGRWMRDVGAPPAADTLALFEDAPIVAQLLERLGVRDDALAARVFALVESPTVKREVDAMRLVQAALALIERGWLAGSLDSATATRLIAALADRCAAGPPARAVADWLAGDLVPAGTPGVDLDARLVGIVAGARPAGAETIEWEGQRYVLDPAAAMRARLARVAATQGRPSIAEAWARVTGTDAVAADGRAAAAALGEALVSLLYAATLPESEPELLASRADLRHDLATEGRHAATERRMWRVAESASSVGVPWHLAGSLIGLDVALAVPSLRRVSDDPPAPTLPGADRLAFARAVAIALPGAMTDATRDRVAALVARGAERLAAATPDAIAAVAASVGLSPWRREALRWAIRHDSQGIPRLFSQTDVARLGVEDDAGRRALDAWGVAPLGGSALVPRFPGASPWEDRVAHDARGGLAASVADLNLRVARFLAARRLPGGLGRDVLSAATLELVDRVVAPRADDWRALVMGIAAIPDVRFEDYVAALTADGPLRPAREAETGQ